jgi:hypothetical protein
MPKTMGIARRIRPQTKLKTPKPALPINASLSAIDSSMKRPANVETPITPEHIAAKPGQAQKIILIAVRIMPVFLSMVGISCFLCFCSLNNYQGKLIRWKHLLLKEQHDSFSNVIC